MMMTGHRHRHQAIMCMGRRYRICCQVMSNGDSEEDGDHDDSDGMDDNDDDIAN
jgi:hypothetical protein